MTTGVVLDNSILRGIADLGGENPQQLLRELFALLLESARTQIDAIAQAAPNDLTTIMRAAHTLKGGASSVGAMELANLAGAIEQRARLRQEGPWLALVAELEAALSRLREMTEGLGLNAAP